MFFTTLPENKNTKTILRRQQKIFKKQGETFPQESCRFSLREYFCDDIERKCVGVCVCVWGVCVWGGGVRGGVWGCV